MLEFVDDDESVNLAGILVSTQVKVNKAVKKGEVDSYLSLR
jgi:hypothetical protein